MREPTEIISFVSRPIAGSFEEYIADQICSGRNIKKHLKIILKGDINMLDYLNEKKNELLDEQSRLENLNQEYAVNEKVAAYKKQVEIELENERQFAINKVLNKIDVLDELITEQIERAAEAVTVEPVEEEVQ